MTAPVTVGVSLKTYFGNARARAWFAEVAPRLQAHPAIADGRVRFFVIPTYLQIPAAIEAFAATPVLVGAQDVSAHPPGAFTGEITAAELAEVGVQVAEIGHAERRRLFGETDEVTASKAAASLEHGMTPVLCIGEDARMSGADAASANLDQLAADLEGVPAGPVVVAYEPVWAIGTGEVATPDDAQEVCGAIRARLRELHGDAAADGVRVLYGGSVKAANVGAIMAQPDVDGCLVGGASLQADEFGAICRFYDMPVL